MKIKLRYGKGHETIEIPAEKVQVLKKRDVSPIEDIEDKIRGALLNPIGIPPLFEIAKGKRDSCILVSDTTRPVPNGVILPPIISTLKQAGISPNKITVLIATGTHDVVPDELLEELLGKEVLLSGVKIISHNAYDDSTLVNLGVGAHNCPAILNKLYVQSELKICTGLIEPHFMAGYSGGRKSICPGIVGIETLKVFHGVAAMGHPLSKSCSLEGNPVQEIAESVAKIVGCDFMVNVTLNDKREITGIFAGDIFKAHRVGCDFVGENSIVEIDSPADIVVTSNGGYPLDQNYYQTVKGLVEASEILRPNGVIVMASECKYGLGKDDFKNLLKELREKTIEQFLKGHSTSEGFRSDQWEVQKLTQVLEKTRNIFLLSGLSDEEYSFTFSRKVHSLNEGLRKAIQIVGRNANIVVIPEGPYIVGRIKTST